jgi:hypothetical protein
MIKLHEVAIMRPPRTEIKNLQDSVEVSFVPMASINEENGKIESMMTRALREVSKGFTFFRENDILFAKITPCMENGKVAVARNMKNGIGFGSTEFFVIRPHDPKLVDWLYYFLRRKSFRNIAKANMGGTVGQQRVPKQFMEDVSIPFPSSTGKRERIIESIESLLRLVDEAKSMREIVNQDSRALIPSTLGNLFNEAFEKKYHYTELKKCFRTIKSGSTPPKKNKTNFVTGEGIVFIKGEHLTKEGSVIMDESNLRINRLNYPVGDCANNQGSSSDKYRWPSSR